MPYKEHIHLHHEGAATIAAGIINAMHRIVIVSRPTTLHQISESIQTLVVCAAGNLDSLAVMETIRMIVEWHDLRPNIFTWNFMKETHELMQSRLLGSFRWLRECFKNVFCIIIYVFMFLCFYIVLIRIYNTNFLIYSSFVLFFF